MHDFGMGSPINPPGATTPDAKEAALEGSIKKNNGKTKDVKYCRTKNDGTLKCKEIKEKTVGVAVAGIRTDRIIKASSLEAGGGDNGGAETLAVHVSQRVYFRKSDELDQFKRDLGL